MNDKNKLRMLGLILVFSCIFQNCHCHSSSNAAAAAVGVPYNFQCSLNKEINRPADSFTPKFKDIIGFQVSRRATHQLITRIFSIFLREIIGYQHIKFFNMPVEHVDDTYKMYKTFDSLIAPLKKWPERLVDLEVWLPPDYHALPRQVSEGGLVTSPGRFGWFVPTQLIEVQNNGTEIAKLLHYSVFQNPENPNFHSFIIEEDIIMQIKELFGFDQEYIPEQCQNNSCTTLLAEYYIDTAFIQKQIEEFKFYTNVLWIGDKYKKSVFWLFDLYMKQQHVFNKRRKKFILLHWSPSDVIDAHINFETVLLPKCEQMNSGQHMLCKYELTPLLKFYAFQFTGATYAFDALEDFYIPKTELQRVLRETNELNQNDTIPIEDVYNSVACNWLKNNEKLYSRWTRNSRILLNIGGLFPLSGAGAAYRNIVPAVQKAVDAINSNSSILSNFKITVLVNDGKCRSDIVMKNFMYYYALSPLLGVLGPACSETVEPIAGVSKHTYTTVISYSAEGSSYMDRKKYPYFFRTIGSNRQYEAVYLNLFKRLEWRRAAALTEDGQKYTEYISHMETLLKENEMELIVNKKFPKETFRDEMKRHLLDLKSKHAKIIIADISNENAQVVMCEAYQLKMTANEGYVWFLPVWLFKNGMNETYLNPYQNVSCTSEELEEIINGHFSFTHSSYASNSSIMQENKTIQQWLEEVRSNSATLSDYAGFAYDAVWVFALAADKLFRNDPLAFDELQTAEVAHRFSDIIWSLDFNGVSGRIRFGEGGSRINDVNILQWINGHYNQVGKYIPEVREEDMKIIGGNLQLNESLIIWLNKDGRPTDGAPICLMAALADMLQTKCENVTLILTSICCLIAVIVVSLASYVFWKKQYDRKIKESAKFMRSFGIDLLSPSMNLHNTLDKWEVPKDRVVINRRLGEGAFGTVYGGEAQFTESDWTAVAVKTLKIGASTDDRLDFLSEAEAMKRFDHKNIIKLLGVCLQTEPIYTIMEFMLYGDLKTFLLARRHLVNEKVSDDSDISSKRLTMMALDVARGLSYLADQKYVHRDIACRNCLVNAQRVVKIGDFGMARPMFENDYYRFNRKGMLPVRWMAPESLGLGLFTPSSDVWSFGILLYEIITFGSFPYQGLTNNQVLDYIKSAKILQIPSATKPHLEGLMRACWNQNYKKRPAASEIVEYISSYPRLFTPCLDVPLSSVEFPETESDQLELLPGLRKRCLGQPNIDILTRASNINNFDDQKITYEKNNESSAQENDRIKNLTVKLNVQPDSISNDENNINAYSPMEPLLKYNSELSGSNISLKRYVPMYSLAQKTCASEHKENPIRIIDATIL